MKVNVVRNSTKRLNNDLSYLRQPDFIQLCRRLKSSHFTRNRKMPLENLLISVPARKGRTLQIELAYFKELFAMDYEISKPGYLKQRMKLNPEAYRELMRHHARNYYADGDASYDFKGYLLLAEDGSSCNVPLTDENVSTFGSVVQHKDRKPRPQIGIASLFDVGNRMLIDLTTEFSKFDERASAVKHISAETDVIGARKAIHIFDRGYPSGSLFLHFQKNSIYFIARLASFHYKKEQLSMNADDEWLDVIFDKSRVSAIRRAGNETAAQQMESAGKIRLRFVRITTPTETTVCLATNIPESLANTDEMAMLYHKRWGIETAFDDLKNKLQIENFTGSKPVIIKQDVYATGYLYNIMVDIMQDADTERTLDEADYRHPLQINRNIAIGLMKEAVIRLILTENAEKQTKIMNGLITEINRFLLPVRPGRSCYRSPVKLESRNSNVRKRSY